MPAINRLYRPIVISGLIFIGLIFPLVSSNEYHLHILTSAFIWTIAVYGLNLLAGFTGYLSLAQAGFFAIGAYSIGLLTTKAGLSYWLSFLLSPLITMAIGLIIGLFALRTREHFFAIYTLCIGYIIYLIIDNWDSLTGGVRGLIGIPPIQNIGPISFDTPQSRYYFVFAILLLVILLVYFIVHSLVGKSFLAIRNSEDLALSIGISTTKNKLLSFVLSTFFAGLAGTLYASFIQFIGPDISNLNVTFDLLVYMIVGGIGTLSGPLIGTLLIIFLSQNLQFLQDYRMLIFGPLLTLIIIFSPRGIAGLFITMKMNWKSKKQMKIDAQNSSLGGE